MNELSTFCDELYHQTLGFCPPECRVYKLATKPGVLPNIDAALEAVNNHGAASALLDRARKQHETHSDQADDRVFDVLTEAIAFAYASCQFPADQFVFTDDKGKHDIESAHFAIEAKSLHPPVDRQEETFASGVVTSRATAGLVHKLVEHLDKGARQLTSANKAGILVVNLLGTDGLLGDALSGPTIEDICRRVQAWIKQHPGISRVVVIWNFHWCEAKVVRQTP